MYFYIEILGRGKSMKKGVIALICMLVALVFIIIAFIGPWYSGKEDNFELNNTLTESTSTIGGQEVTVKFEDMPDSDVKDVFGNTYLLTIVTLVFAILSLLLVAIHMFKMINMDMLKMIASIFVILTFILAIVTALYFMTALPASSEWNGDFFQDNAGPGYAWYLMLVGGIFALISGIFLFTDKKSAPLAPSQ
jgi:ABC-type polysaccharide transport system permease subunit